MSHVKDKVIFEAKSIVRRDRRVNDVSFTLREGEILGFAGLVGAGRTELMNVIFERSGCSLEKFGWTAGAFLCAALSLHQGRYRYDHRKPA